MRLVTVAVLGVMIAGCGGTSEIVSAPFTRVSVHAYGAERKDGSYVVYRQGQGVRLGVRVRPGPGRPFRVRVHLAVLLNHRAGIWHRHATYVIRGQGSEATTILPRLAPRKYQVEVEYPADGQTWTTSNLLYFLVEP